MEAVTFLSFTEFLNFNNRRSRLHFSTLVCLWFIGLLIGIFLAHSYNVSSFSFKHFINQGSSSFLTIIFIFIPICFAVITINSSFFYITHLIVLIEAISKGFTGFFLFALFGDSAWLIRILFLFLGDFAAVLLWFFLINSVRCISHFRLSNIYNIVLWSIVIVLINHFLIFDFLITIL